MSITERSNFFNVVEVDGNKELDYLQIPAEQMNLRTSEFFRVTSSTAHRIDLISFLFYKNYDFGWLIAEHNNIQDPINDIAVGVELRIPSLDDYYQYYNRYSRRV